MRSVESGRDLFKNLRDALKSSFNSLVLRPVINFIVNPIANVIGGFFTNLLGGILGTGGGGAGGGLLNTASNGVSAYNLYSNGMQGVYNGVGGFTSLFGYGSTAGAGAGTLGFGNFVSGAGGDGLGALIGANNAWRGVNVVSGVLAGTGAGGGANTIGTVVGSTQPAVAGGGGAGAGGMGAAAGAAFVLSLPFIGMAISDWMDRGDAFSGAAYATSDYANDPTMGVGKGLTKFDPRTGLLPDREALIKELTGLGADAASLESMNDRALVHYAYTLQDRIEFNKGIDGGGILPYEGSREGANTYEDFYRGRGYADPEALGWWNHTDLGENEWGPNGERGHMMSDPRMTDAARKLAIALINPMEAIDKALGGDSSFKVATGMAANNKTGKILGGLQIWKDGETTLNWGKKEFDNKDEYLRTLFSDTIGSFKKFDLPKWATEEVDKAQAALKDLKGDNVGEEAAKIYKDSSDYIAKTITTISKLIEVVPEFNGVTQDVVFNIGKLMGGVDNLTSAYGNYVQGYYSDSERASYVNRDIKKTLKEAGVDVELPDYNSVDAQKQFRALVESLDLTTESGQKAFATLMLIAPAFKEITGEGNRLVQMLKQRRSLEADLLEAQGRSAEAEKIRRDAAIEGMDAVQAAQYDANEALRKQVADLREVMSSIGSPLAAVLREGLLGNLSREDLGGKMADAVIGGVYNAIASNFANQITTLMVNAVTRVRSITHTELAEIVGSTPWASAKLLNNYLAPLRGMFKLVCREHKFPNPLEGIDNAKHQSQPPDPLTTEQVGQVLAWLKKNQPIEVWAYFLMAFGSGMRPEELIALRWKDVDEAAGTINVARARSAGEVKSLKTYSIRDVDITALTREALKTMRPITEGKQEEIFRNPVTKRPWHDERSQRDHYWVPALKACKIRARRAYQTRHTYATTALSNGANPAYISRQMGHRNAQMLFNVYSKWIDGDDRGREKGKVDAAYGGVLSQF